MMVARWSIDAKFGYIRRGRELQGRASTDAISSLCFACSAAKCERWL